MPLKPIRKLRGALKRALDAVLSWLSPFRPAGFYRKALHEKEKLGDWKINRRR